MLLATSALGFEHRSLENAMNAPGRGFPFVLQGLGREAREAVEQMATGPLPGQSPRPKAGPQGCPGGSQTGGRPLALLPLCHCVTWADLLVSPERLLSCTGSHT